MEQAVDRNDTMENLESRQFVSFFINDKIYGIDIRLVNEIYPKVEITPVPLTEPFIAGLMNIRGQIVLVVDLAVIFGQEKCKISPDSHIIILKTYREIRHIQSFAMKNLESLDDKPIAFLADQISDVQDIKSDEIEDIPGHINPRIAYFLEGIIKLDERILTIINPGKILEGTEIKLDDQSM